MKEFKTQSTKAFHQIPKEIRNKYHIHNEWHDNSISIHEPAFINVDEPRVEKHGCVYTIRNDKVNVSLWIGNFYMHTTVY